MAQPAIDKIRNIGIIAHIDAGKTTTTERILYYADRIHTTGEVDEGTTTTDWYYLEKEMGITIFSAATTVYWNNHQLNIIDTPGHIDFTAEVERSLRVLDGVIIVFCGVAGVQAQSETVWKQANRYGLPRLAYINKLDRTGADYEKVFKDITDKLNCQLAPVTVPINSEEDEFTGVINLLDQNEYYFSQDDKGRTVNVVPIKDVNKDIYTKWKEVLFDCLSKYDDQILSLLVEEEDIPEDKLCSAIRELTLSNKIVPVYAGSSLKNMGVQPLMDGVVYFLPSPEDRTTIHSKIYDNKLDYNIDLSKENETLLYVFKTFSDLHNTNTYARIYSGKVQKGMKLLNTRSKKHERIGTILKVHADSVTPSAYAGKGEIIALSNLKHTKTGDTLVLKKNIVLEDLTFPTTVVSVSIEPKYSSDRDKLLTVLERISIDDPTFKYTTDEETNQLLISGMGELHLNIVAQRIEKDFRVNVKIGKPMVAYKETILDRSKAEYTHSAKLQDKPIYGHVGVTLLPNKSSFEPVIEFSNSLSEEALKYTDTISNAIIGALQSGEILGYQVIYLKCIIEDIKITENSHEFAYFTAASNAVKMALKDSDSTVLEPFMKLNISTPEEYLGNVLNDLNARNVSVKEMKKGEIGCDIECIAPLSQTFGFADSLRSKTQGRGFFIMEPFEYKEVPKNRLKSMIH